MNPVQILMMNQQPESTEGGGYGYLYNGWCAYESNFGPSGWHIPTKSEYEVLVNYLGGWSTLGGKLKETGYAHWDSPNTGATNSSGFTAYGSGTRTSSTGNFVFFKRDGRYASSTHNMNVYGGQLDEPLFIILKYDKENVLGWYGADVRDGYSFRLLKDSTTLSHGQTSTMTDYDGNVYDTICIGTQEWTVQNWKCTKLNDGTPLTKVTSNTTWATASTGDLYYCAYDNDESYV